MSGGVDLVVPFSQASQDVDFVSFDLFETLLLFPLPGPAQMWEMVGSAVGMPDFALLRAGAEAKALRRAQAHGRQTVSHDEIFDCLDLPAAPREFAKRTELLYETALWHPDPHLREIYKNWVGAGRALIIAETAHCSAFIARLLARVGLPEAPLFVSSEMGVSKADGRLFTLAAERLAVPPQRIVHVGRRAREDLEPAAAAGFRTHPVDRLADAPAAGTGASVLSYGLRRLGPDRRQDPIRSLAFQMLGPLYCAFLRWMEWHARINAIDTILLLPGFGQSLEQLASTLGVSALPPRAVLRTSELALILAGISDRTFDEKIGFLLREAEGQPVSDLLSRLDVPIPSERVMADLGLGDDVIIGVEQHPLLRRFLMAYRWPILAAARRSRREIFQALLAQGVKPGARVALVAADWDGSLQEAFEQAVDGVLEIEVYGYSLGLLDLPETRRRQARMHIKAMLGRDSVSGPTLDLLARRQREVDALLLAPDGFHLRRAGPQAEEAPSARTELERQRLKEVARSLAEGTEAFSRLFNSFIVATGYQAEPLDIAVPFLEGLADLQAETELMREGLGPASVRPATSPSSGARLQGT